MIKIVIPCIELYNKIIIILCGKGEEKINTQQNHNFFIYFIQRNCKGHFEKKKKVSIP